MRWVFECEAFWVVHSEVGGMMAYIRDLATVLTGTIRFGMHGHLMG